MRVTIFCGKLYLLWKTQLEALLSRQKLLGFVNGQTAPPDETVTAMVNDVPVVTRTQPLKRGEPQTSLSSLGSLEPLLKRFLVMFTTSTHLKMYGFLLLITSTKAQLQESLIS